MANWPVLDDLIIPITAPDYVLQALKERININFNTEKKLILIFKLFGMNPNLQI